MSFLLLLALAVIHPSRPSDCFPDSVKTDPVMRKVYCRDLEAVDEGLLAGMHAYRFLYSPTYDRVVVAAIEWSGDKALARGKVLTNRGRRTAGELRSTTALVTGDQWRLLLQRLENAGFGGDREWEGNQPEDGGFWVLEGLEGKKYRFYEYGAVQENRLPQLYKALHYMAELAGIAAETLTRDPFPFALWTPLRLKKLTSAVWPFDPRQSERR